MTALRLSPAHERLVERYAEELSRAGTTIDHSWLWAAAPSVRVFGDGETWSALGVADQIALRH